VPVGKLPVAVNAPVDVGDSEHPVAHRAAVDADVAALEAHRAGEVAAGGDDRVLQVDGIGAGEAAALLSSRARSRPAPSPGRPQRCKQCGGGMRMRVASSGMLPRD